MKTCWEFLCHQSPALHSQTFFCSFSLHASNWIAFWPWSVCRGANYIKHSGPRPVARKGSELKSKLHNRFAACYYWPKKNLFQQSLLVPSEDKQTLKCVQISILSTGFYFLLRSGDFFSGEKVHAQIGPASIGTLVLLWFNALFRQKGSYFSDQTP